MILRTKVRDCLYLNWAVPVASAPLLPEPLRYQRTGERQDRVFASALLFHHEGLRLRLLPFARLSHPQLHLRYYVIDGDGRPAVYLHRTFAPLWSVPGIRLLGGPPVRPARMVFARPSRDPEAGRWRWRVLGRRALDLVGDLGAPRAGEGPELGSWEETVRFFRERNRAYWGREDGLRRIETEQPEATTWPMQIDLEQTALIGWGLDLPASPEGLPALHSSWLCPEIPMTFELVRVREPEEPVRRSVPGAGGGCELRRAPTRRRSPKS